MKENEPLPNFFAGETFMHFNIGVGILVIFVIFMVVVTRRRDWRKYGDSSVAKRYVCDPRLLAAGLVVLVAANLLVSSHLYHRVAGVVFKSAWRVDESARQCANASHWLVFNASWAQQL